MTAAQPSESPRLRCRVSSKGRWPPLRLAGEPARRDRRQGPALSACSGGSAGPPVPPCRSILVSLVSPLRCREARVSSLPSASRLLVPQLEPSVITQSGVAGTY